MQKLIVILGPTASGKTKLALKLAEKFNGEIISADSRQVYKDMDIGTGKDLNEYREIKYHLINLVKPNQDFNVAKFKTLAIKKIKEIHKRNKTPLLVGGTGLYISSIVDNYDIPKVKPDKKTRNILASLNKSDKIKMLKKLDPAALEFIDINNPRRLDRALEVCLSGKKFSSARKKAKPLFNTLQIGIKLSKAELNQKINQRIDQMIEQGLINEVKNLIKKYPPSSRRTSGLRRTSGQYPSPLQTIGYKEIIDHLQTSPHLQDQNSSKAKTFDKVVELIKLHTRQFAKRQMTWFKRDKQINWVKDAKAAEKLVQEFLITLKVAEKKR